MIDDCCSLLRSTQHSALNIQPFFHRATRPIPTLRHSACHSSGARNLLFSQRLEKAGVNRFPGDPGPRPEKKLRVHPRNPRFAVFGFSVFWMTAITRDRGHSSFTLLFTSPSRVGIRCAPCIPATGSLPGQRRERDSSLRSECVQAWCREGDSNPHELFEPCG